MKSFPPSCAKALRDGGIVAVAALDVALAQALAEVPPAYQDELKLAIGRAMAAVLDETVNRAVEAYPELDPDATWMAIVKSRAATLSAS